MGASAACTVLVAGASGVLAAGVPITEANAEQKAAAQARYEAGTRLFGAGRYEAALKEFRASYDTVASPNAHLMIARSLAETGDAVRAYNELSVVEKEAKVSEKYAPTLDQSATFRAELLKKVAIVVVSVTGGSGATTARVAGKDVALGEQFAVPPGQTEVVVTVDGKDEKRQHAALAAGEIHPFRFEIESAIPEPVPTADDHADHPHTESTGSRTGYWVGAGVFGAVAVGGFVLAGVEWTKASADFKDLKTYCQDASSHCNDAKPSGGYKTRKDSITKERTLTIAGDVGGGIAAAAAVTFLVVGLTRPKHTTSDSAVDWHVGPTAVEVVGRF